MKRTSRKSRAFLVVTTQGNLKHGRLEKIQVQLDILDDIVQLKFRVYNFHTASIRVVTNTKRPWNCLGEFPFNQNTNTKQCQKNDSEGTTSIKEKTR